MANRIFGTGKIFEGDFNTSFSGLGQISVFVLKKTHI
jgi:hypothetical protein